MYRLIQGPIVSTFVGPGRQEFFAHKPLLCHYSKYFQGALNNNFIESQTHVVELRDVDPEAFQYVLAWMYDRKTSTVDIGGKDNAVASCSLLCQTYYCADFLRVEELLGTLLVKIDAMLDVCRQMKVVCLDSELIINVYENTPDTSPLRAAITCEIARLFRNKDTNVNLASFNDCFRRLDDFGTQVVTQLQQSIPDSDEAGPSTRRPKKARAPDANRAARQMIDITNYPSTTPAARIHRPPRVAVPPGAPQQNRHGHHGHHGALAVLVGPPRQSHGHHGYHAGAHQHTPHALRQQLAAHAGVAQPSPAHHHHHHGRSVVPTGAAQNSTARNQRHGRTPTATVGAAATAQPSIAVTFPRFLLDILRGRI